MAQGLVIWYGLGGLGPRGRLSAEKHLGCSKLAGKLPVLKRGCLPEEHNKSRSDCKETKLLPRRPHLDTGCSVTCKPEEARMLLAWVHTFLLSNMLLAEAYGSGGEITFFFPFCSNLNEAERVKPPDFPNVARLTGKEGFGCFSCYPTKAFFSPLSPSLLARGLQLHLCH